MFTIEDQILITSALLIMRDVDAENGHTDEVAKTNAVLTKLRTLISQGNSVYIATYQHKYGSDVLVFRTMAGAEAWKRELASDYWAEISDEDFPVDGAERYFEEMGNRELEWFSIEQSELGE